MSKGIYKSNKDIDGNMLLGYLFFYNLGEMKLTEQQLEDAFNRNNVSTSFIRKIGKADAFRRASSKTERSVVVNYNGEQRKALIDVDEVKSDSDGIIRIVGRKVVDAKNADIDYVKIGKINFVRSSEQVFTKLEPGYGMEYFYEDIMTGIKQRYTEWSTFHTKETVRNITNTILKSMHPVNLLDTGLCKFIPKTNKQLLYDLKDLINDLSQFGAGNVFEIIPVIDTDEQRQLVGSAAEREVKNDLEEFVQELKDKLINQPSLSSKTVTSYVQRFKELSSKVNEYENLLGCYMQTLNQQIVQALDYVDANKEKKE